MGFNSGFKGLKVSGTAASVSDSDNKNILLYLKGHSYIRKGVENE